MTVQWVNAGVWYCLEHHGVGDEDTDVCDFREDDESDCDRTELCYRTEVPA